MTPIRAHSMRPAAPSPSVDARKTNRSLWTLTKRPIFVLDSPSESTPVTSRPLLSALKTLLRLSAALFLGLPLRAQSIAVTVPNGNNVYQVTNPKTGITYAINVVPGIPFVFTDTAELVTIYPSGTHTTQRFVFPQNYRIAGRGHTIDLDANGTISLTLADFSVNRYRVVQYHNFDVTNPDIISLPLSSAAVTATTASGRIVGYADGYAAELIPGGYIAAPGQVVNGGFATTAWEGQLGFGYAGSITTAAFVQESFIYEGGVMSDPFATLGYDAALIQKCSRFGRFCFGSTSYAVASDQMYSVDRISGQLTGFVLQDGTPFAPIYVAGAREDGWAFGSGFDQQAQSPFLWAANPFVWGNVVKPLDDYCLAYLQGVRCSAFKDINYVTEYFDPTAGQWRANFAFWGSFESLSAPSGSPIYGVPKIPNETTVPEPSALTMLGLGALALLGACRRPRSVS